MDYLRQLGILNPTQIGKKEITLVGAGATGSYVALALTQLGWGDTPRGQGVLRVFDDDIVEEHNICNQLFDIAQVGRPKVEALKEIIKRKCGIEIEAINEKVDDNTEKNLIQSDYVFILTDTMKSRKEIFEKHLMFSYKTELVVETRMGIEDGRVYAFCPGDIDQRKAWMDTLYTDEEADVSACGASESIVTTVMFVASLAAQRVVHHFNREHGEDNLKSKGADGQKMWNEVQISLHPEDFVMRRFGQETKMLQEI